MNSIFTRHDPAKMRCSATLPVLVVQTKTIDQNSVTFKASGVYLSDGNDYVMRPWSQIVEVRATDEFGANVP